MCRTCGPTAVYLRATRNLSQLAGASNRICAVGVSKLFVHPPLLLLTSYCLSDEATGGSAVIIRPFIHRALGN